MLNSHVAPDGTEKIRLAGDTFQFAVFGDSGVIAGKSDYPSNAILSQMVQNINRQNLVLAVYTGDGVEQGGPVANMYLFREELSKLKFPYYPLIGNHEIFRGAAYDGTKGDGEGNFIKVFKDRLPLKDSRGRQVCYYSFDYQDAHFIVLNTAWQHRAENDKKGLYPGGEQWRWLVQDLESSRARSRNIFIFCHEPPLLPDLAGGVLIPGGLSRLPIWKNAKAVESFNLLCQEYRVDAVFSGHLHAYANFKDGDVTHIITGGAGSSLHLPAVMGGYYHYVVCTVSGDQVQYEAVRLD